MNHRLFVSSLLVAPLLVGCGKKLDDAPPEIGDASIFLFANFDGDADDLVLALEDLEGGLADIDLRGDLKDRRFAPPEITEDDMGGAEYPADADWDAQVPVLVVGLSRHGVDDNIGLVGESSQVCIESNTTIDYERTFDTDKGCFLDGSCDGVETSNHVHKKNPLADIWYNQMKDYRTLTMSDGRPAMIARSWVPEKSPGEGGNTSLDQSYTIEAWIESPDSAGETLRHYAMWSSVTITGVGDDFYSNLVADGLDEGMQNADNYVDGVMCPVLD